MGDYSEKPIIKAMLERNEYETKGGTKGGLMTL